MAERQMSRRTCWHSAAIPKGKKTAVLLIPDHHPFRIGIPVVYVQSYRLDELLQKKLFFFLPFYPIRYEKDFRKKKNLKNLLRNLDEDIKSIESAIAATFINSDHEYCYSLINDLIRSIFSAIIPDDDEALRNEVNTIMGGHTIQTPTTIILDQGIQQGIKQGIQLANEAAQKRYVKNLMKTLKVSVERAMELLEIPQENRQNILKTIDQ